MPQDASPEQLQQLLHSVVSPAPTLSGESLKRLQRLAATIMREWQLMAWDTPCQLLELEVYCQCPSHHDPFAHANSIQLQTGRWYFHRLGCGYKGGSFKGLDFTFGDTDKLHGGLLIRTLRVEEPGAVRVINGPSLCVDFLLKQSNCDAVASLDQLVENHRIGDTRSPLHLRHRETPLDDEDSLFTTARVGLSLKRIAAEDAKPYLIRPLRLLTSPRDIKKGRAHLILALHLRQWSIDAIRTLTGSPRKSIAALIGHVESVQGVFSDFAGKGIDNAELAQLHAMAGDDIAASFGPYESNSSTTPSDSP